MKVYRHTCANQAKKIFNFFPSRSPKKPKTAKTALKAGANRLSPPELYRRGNLLHQSPASKHTYRFPVLL